MRSVEKTWNETKNMIHEASYTIPSITRPCKRFFKRDTWLLNNDVQIKVHGKNSIKEFGIILPANAIVVEKTIKRVKPGKGTGLHDITVGF